MYLILRALRDCFKSGQIAGKVGICLLLASLVTLIAGTAEAQVASGPIYCNNYTAINAQAAGTVKVVADPLAGPTGAFASNDRVFVCGWNLNAGAAVSSFQFQQGTGATCTTASNANLTGTFNLPINGSNTDSSPNARGLVTAPGVGLCLVVTNTGPLNGVIFWAQQ